MNFLTSTGIIAIPSMFALFLDLTYNFIISMQTLVAGRMTAVCFDALLYGDHLKTKAKDPFMALCF